MDKLPCCLQSVKLDLGQTPLSNHFYYILVTFQTVILLHVKHDGMYSQKLKKVELRLKVQKLDTNLKKTIFCQFNMVLILLFHILFYRASCFFCTTPCSYWIIKWRNAKETSNNLRWVNNYTTTCKLVLTFVISHVCFMCIVIFSVLSLKEIVPPNKWDKNSNTG